MLVESPPHPRGVLVIVGVRFRKIVVRLPVIGFGRAPDEAVSRVIRRESILRIPVTPDHKINHPAEDRQAPPECCDFARVVVSPRRVLEEHSGVQRRLNLVLSVVEKISVRKNVMIQVVLEVRLNLIGQIPNLVRPHELVMRHREQGVAAHGDFRVGAFSDLVSRLEAAVAATRKHDARASCVEQPLVRDFHFHAVFKKMVPLVPDAGEGREKIARGPVPVPLEELGSRQRLRGVCVALRNESAFLAPRQHDPDAPERPRVGARRQDDHHLIAHSELRVPDADVRRRQVSPEQRPLAVTGDVFVQVLRRQEAPRVKEPPGQVGSPE